MSVTRKFIADIVNQYDSLCLDDKADRETLINHLYEDIKDDEVMADSKNTLA